MEQINVSEQNTRLEKLTMDSLTTAYGLSVIVLYEDPETRNWAREVYERAASVAGRENARVTWWKMNELSIPAVLAGAVSTAMRADVVVLAARANEALPMPFYVWAENWAPHRLSTAGALFALLSTPAADNPEQRRFREYLGMIARQGRMDLLVEERELPTLPAGKPERKRISNRRPGSTGFLTLAFAS